MGTYIEKRAQDLNKPIVDATDPLALEVKPIDVVRASEANSKCCAYVRACEREVPGVEAAFFFRTTAYLEFNDKIVRYRLPESVQKEIVAFDRHRSMEPGLYQLSPMAPSKTVQASRKRNARRKKTQAAQRGISGQKRSVIHRTQGIRTLNEPTYRSRP